MQFTKNYNLQRFKKLQYVDLKLDFTNKKLLLEKWKDIFLNHLNKF